VLLPEVAYLPKVGAPLVVLLSAQCHVTGTPNTNAGAASAASVLVASKSKGRQAHR
jgi:hypothetical protein